jgi:hypothetical protein
MIVGYPPFYADTPNDTCKKIIKWKQYLQFPSNCNLSYEAIDLMKSLITDVDKRLGYNGAIEVKNHPFFRGIDWNNIKRLKPPFVPKLDNPWDTKHFDKYEETGDFYPNDITDDPKPLDVSIDKEQNMKKKPINYNSKNNKKKDVCFIDFTYKKQPIDNQNLINALEIMNEIKRNFNEVREEIEKEKHNQIEKRRHIRENSKLAKKINPEKKI